MVLDDLALPTFFTNKVRIKMLLQNGFELIVSKAHKLTLSLKKGKKAKENHF